MSDVGYVGSGGGNFEAVFSGIARSSDGVGDSVELRVELRHERHLRQVHSTDDTLKGLCALWPLQSNQAVLFEQLEIDLVSFLGDEFLQMLDNDVLVGSIDHNSNSLLLL